MDEGCSDAVKEVFVRLYEQGSDLPRQPHGQLVPPLPHLDLRCRGRIRGPGRASSGICYYPVKETGEMLELATTRPETMLGDTAVAINAEDPRYTHLHRHAMSCCRCWGARFPSSATSTPTWKRAPASVKITPAHDPNDFEVGKRHDLPDDPRADLRRPHDRCGRQGRRRRREGRRPRCRRRAGRTGLRQVRGHDRAGSPQGYSGRSGSLRCACEG